MHTHCPKDGRGTLSLLPLAGENSMGFVLVLRMLTSQEDSKPCENRPARSLESGAWPCHSGSLRSLEVLSTHRREMAGSRNRAGLSVTQSVLNSGNPYFGFLSALTM